MAVKSTDNPGMTKNVSSTAGAEADRETESAPTSKEEGLRQERIANRECVVEADFHVGLATPGSVVCSYHAMHYDANGNRRQ
jgi:hypothetical protein